MATPVAVEKKITCPVEKAAQVLQLMTQLGLSAKGTATGTTPGTIEITAELTDDQVKALQEVIAKLERRETVANILHKAGSMATKTVDFTVNDVAKPAVGMGLQIGAGLLGSVVKFGTETGAKLVNEVAEAGVKTVNDVKVSEDAQKFKGSLRTIGSCFGLFETGESEKIKIA